MIERFPPLSARPYLVRAMHEWCANEGLTPYIVVHVDDSVQVPREYVRNRLIVLNISTEATGALKLGDEFIEFQARFSGQVRQIVVPVACVLSIYARENGEGLTLGAAMTSGESAKSDVPDAAHPGAGAGSAKVLHLVSPDSASTPEPVPPKPPSGGGSRKPALKRVK